MRHLHYKTNPSKVQDTYFKPLFIILCLKAAVKFMTCGFRRGVQINLCASLNPQSNIPRFHGNFIMLQSADCLFLHI